MSAGEYPPSLQTDVDDWIARLAHADVLDEDGPSKALRPTSLRNHRASIRQFAHALVECSVPPNEIRSLSDLVDLNNYRKGIAHLIERNGNVRPPGLTLMVGHLDTSKNR